MGQNEGTSFERELEDIFTAYARQGLAKIHKVDPPTKVIRKGAKVMRVIFLENPFVDFIGTWLERGGRTLIIEAKHTAEPRLTIGGDTAHGLTAEQWSNCMAWEAAGAVVLIVWRHERELRVTTPAQCRALCIMHKRKSIRWCDAHRLERGFGFVHADILAFARKLTDRPE